MPLKPIEHIAGLSPEAERPLVELYNGLASEINRL